MNSPTLTKSQVIYSVLRGLAVVHLLHLLHFVAARAQTTREAIGVCALILAEYCVERWTSHMSWPTTPLASATAH